MTGQDFIRSRNEPRPFAGPIGPKRIGLVAFGETVCKPKE